MEWTWILLSIVGDSYMWRTVVCYFNRYERADRETLPSEARVEKIDRSLRIWLWVSTQWVRAWVVSALMWPQGEVVNDALRSFMPGVSSCTSHWYTFAFIMTSTLLHSWFATSPGSAEATHCKLHWRTVSPVNLLSVHLYLFFSWQSISDWWRFSLY